MNKKKLDSNRGIGQVVLISIVVIVIIVIVGGAYAAVVLSSHSTATTHSTTSTNTSTSGSQGYTVQIASSSSSGKYLENGTGFTLYMFGKDKPGNGTSACTGSCAGAWPPFYAGSGSMNLPSGLSASNFSTITRSDGSKQTTYNGWPLYYFSSDTSAGSMLGEGANQYGGLWYAIPPTMQQSGGQVIGGPAYTVGIAYEPSFGLYLTNSSGFTLYYRSTDTPNSGNTTCNTSICEANWPVFYNATLNLPPGLSSSQFKTITPYNSTKIVTFNGYPLFYWSHDAKPGDATGQGIGSFYVANLTLAATTTTSTATSSSTSHTTSSAGGYY
jgi:predicted lipoprotein with Yx(FWY)xxD motif